MPSSDVAPGQHLRHHPSHEHAMRRGGIPAASSILHPGILEHGGGPLVGVPRICWPAPNTFRPSLIPSTLRPLGAMTYAMYDPATVIFVDPGL